MLFFSNFSRDEMRLLNFVRASLVTLLVALATCNVQDALPAQDANIFTGKQIVLVFTDFSCIVNLLDRTSELFYR